MDILLAILISGASVFGGFMLLRSQGKKAFDCILYGDNYSKMIGDGKEKKPRAKILDKLPLINPAASNNSTNNQGNGNNSSLPMSLMGNRIPNMRGVNNGNDNMPATQPAPRRATAQPAPIRQRAGGGVSATAVIGVVNGIGAVVQSGGLVNNNFVSRRQRTGAVIQGASAIQNIRLKGSKKLIQRGNNFLNVSNGGKTRMNQGNGVRNAIQGKVNIRPAGIATNYINGGVKSIKSRLGNIATPNLQIKGISKAQSLMVKNFYAPKGLKLRLKQMNEGIGTVAPNYYLPERNENAEKSNNKRRLRLMSGPKVADINNIGVNLNDINLQKKDEYNLQQMRYLLNKNSANYAAMVNMSKIMMNPKNQKLTTVQRNKLYNLNRVSTVERKEGTYNRDDMFRQLVSNVPQMTSNDMRRVANEANRLGEQRKRVREQAASKVADEKFDINKENMEALNNILKNTSNNSAANLQGFIAENFKEELTSDLSEEKIKNIEKQARENISKREDIPLEKKEEEYEKEKEKLMEKEKDERTKVVEDMLKDRILEDKDEAKAILGDEAAEELQKEKKSIVEKKEKIKIKENIGHNLKDYMDFKKKHPEYNGMEPAVIYKAKKEEEMKEDLQTAIGKLYSRKGKGQINSYGQDTNKKRNLQTEENPLQNQNRIYVPPMINNGGI